MKIPYIIMLMISFTIIGATEIITPIGKFDLEAKCVDITLMNNSNTNELPQKITVNEDGRPIIFLTEGQRMVTIKSGNATDVKIQNEKDVLSQAVLINPLFKEFVIDFHDYVYHKSFSKKNERFETSKLSGSRKHVFLAADPSLPFPTRCKQRAGSKGTSINSS